MTVITLADINPRFRALNPDRRERKTQHTPCESCGGNVGPWYGIYKLCETCLNISPGAVTRDLA